MAEIDKAAPLPGVMPNRLPENAPAPEFDARAIAKALLRSTRAGTLATIDRNTGHPFASLVNVATDVDGSPLILVSRLSTHTANLESEGRASLLFASVGRGDPLAYPRLTVLGTFTPATRQDLRDARLRRRFLARHPKSELYAGFADFSFWQLEIISAHLNGGFGRAADLNSFRRSDRPYGRGRTCRGGSERHYAYEQRPCRSGTPVRHQAAWRRRRTMAADRA